MVDVTMPLLDIASNARALGRQYLIEIGIWKRPPDSGIVGIVGCPPAVTVATGDGRPASNRINLAEF
jgi:hypothetical protein